MTNLRLPFFAALMLLIFFSACAPKPGVPVTGASPQPPASSQPTLQSPNSLTVLQSVPPGPPAMQVGSAYRYFDGSLLDAIPNDGPFEMGPGPQQAQSQVTVSDFWIYSTEVTNQMYAWCVSLGKCKPPGDPNYKDPHVANDPVVSVTWQQAADYCSFAHGRLPTEAEWEKAASWDATARQKRLYPWGDHDPTCDLLNFDKCQPGPVSVLQFGQGQSFYGAYNMEGNVAEWVSDWYNPGYQFGGKDPQGPASGKERSVRGSAFDWNAAQSSPTQRFSAKPESQPNNLGFRCVVQDPAFFAPYCEMPVFYGIDPHAVGTAVPNPCPDPTIETSQFCALNATRRVNITVQTSGSTLVQVTGMESCNPASNETGVRHDCGPNTTVQVKAVCNAAPPGAVACPPNYRQDPNDPARCISPGGPGSCPVGFNYNSSLQCCSAASQGAAAIPLCSVGQHFFNGACVDDGTGLQQPHSLTFSTGSDVSCLSILIPGKPTRTALPTSTPIPTNTPIPTGTPFPTRTNTPFATPTKMPVSTGTTQPTITSQPTSTPPPTATPPPTDTPQPTATPQATEAPTNPPPPTATAAAIEPPPPSDTPPA